MCQGIFKSFAPATPTSATYGRRLNPGCTILASKEHLVEELAGILWRKRRLRLAEAASHQRGLEECTHSYRDTAKTALVPLGTSKQIERVVDAVRATPQDTA